MNHYKKSVKINQLAINYDLYADFEDARKRFCVLTDDLWGDQWTPFMYQKRYPSGISNLSWIILGEEK